MLKSVPSSEPVEHSVGLYLNGFNDLSRTAIVVFTALSVKEQYIIDEAKFCRKEEDLYNLARYKNQRERAKDELLAKRVAFANYSGYKPTLSDATRFEYVGKRVIPKLIA